ncbi:hypothetical protein Hamer_G009352 [Homarus americanus]|uniref:Uncharacterized protein n=1 Tax=Homarus americanus TaxID=6706 RepID=A0A8J5JDC4_HOMAM|nr:hypothetical protein Hamer_G009352 [Homarus americanus]
MRSVGVEADRHRSAPGGCGGVLFPCPGVPLTGCVVSWVVRLTVGLKSSALVFLVTGNLLDLGPIKRKKKEEEGRKKFTGSSPYIIVKFLKLISQHQSKHVPRLKEFTQLVEELERKVIHPLRYQNGSNTGFDSDGTTDRVRFCTQPSPLPTGSVLEPKEYVRPLGILEFLLSIGGHYGSMNTVQALKLSSTQPIPVQTMMEAVTTVAQRTEFLQMCVKIRWLWPWFCRVTHLKIPFSVEHGDPIKSKSGRHEAVLIFAVHHTITDAYTNMVICRETLKVLNASMMGQVYQPTPRACVSFTCDKLITVTDWFHAIKFSIYKVLNTPFGDANSLVYFNGAIPQPKTKSSISKVFHEEFTEEATLRLRQCCRDQGITVHSCVVTVARLAYFQLAQRLSDVEIKQGKIRIMNCVNMRRFFPIEYQEATGCHVSVEEQEVTVNNTDGSSKVNFWSIAKEYHADVYRNIYRNLTDNHFVTTNMGDLRDLLPGKYGDGPVEITNVLRCVSDCYTGHPFTLVFQTFRDRFSVNVEYYDNKIRHEDAALFFSILTNHISDIMSYGTIGVSEDRSANVVEDKFYPTFDDHISCVDWWYEAATSSSVNLSGSQEPTVEEVKAAQETHIVYSIDSILVENSLARLPIDRGD